MRSKLGVGLAGLVLLTLVAFLQARAVASLLGGALGPSPHLPEPRAVAAGAPAAPRSGAEILRRNPFDSSWRTEQARRAGSGPLDAPRCSKLELAVVSESDDAAWSLASLVVAAPHQSRLVRRGDRVGDREVVHVGRNPLLDSPAVWLQTNDELCQIVLRERALNGIRAPSAAEQAPLPNPKIRRLEGGEHEIDRSLLADLFTRQRELASHARPARTADGKVAARLVRVTPGSILGQAGFSEGDLLIGVDGRDMSTPESALAALIAVRNASHFDVDVERGGRRLTLGFRIR